MDEQTHYRDDQIMIRDTDQGHKDNQNVTILPRQVFARVMEVLPNIASQEESMLKPWIDPHQLKQHQGVWYKDGQQVVTGISKISVTLFNLTTIPLFTETLE
jgi:hypothetical protein